MPVVLSLSKHAEAVSDLESRSLLVVPTRRRIRHLTREILAQEARVTSAIPLFTIELLATRIFQTVFGNIRIIDEPIRTLLFHQAIVSSQESFAYFTPHKRGSRLPQGTFNRIVHVIRKLKEVGVYPHALAEEVALGDAEEQPKLRDIAAIYTSYESLLAALDGVDAEGVLKALATGCTQQRFNEAFRLLFPDVGHISIVGFDEFTEPEIGFLQKLRDVGRAISFTFDFQHGNRSLFGHLEKNYRRFAELGFVDQGDVAKDPLPRTEQRNEVKETMQHISSALFHRPKRIEKKDCTKLVTVVKAKDRRCEVELICKVTKQWITDHPASDVSKICVAFYRPQPYSAIIREQFAKFGIPVNVTDRFELSQSPVVVSIIGLLQMSVRNLHRDDVLRVLSSAYLDFRIDGRRVDRANLERVSLDMRILGGAQSWQEKIDQQIARVGQEKLTWNDEGERARRTQDIERLRKAKADIEYINALLHEISRDLTPDGFRQKLQRLLDSLDISRKIVSGGDSALIEKDARAFAKFLEVVAQMSVLLEYQDGKARTHSLKFYLEQLKVALSQERYTVREQFGSGVLVTSIDETRGLPMDVMIIGGLVDGEFPSNYQSELFFSARRLKEREQRHVWENRYLFYQAITNWSTHLYLTFPGQDADLDLVRSSFVDALKNIVEVEEWNYPEVSRFHGTVYSTEDFLRERGRQIRGGIESTQVIPSAVRSQVKHTTHAIAVEHSRAGMNNLPEYAGMIFDALSGDAKTQLEQLKHRVYSVSQLETYGKCPFQFFAQRLLRLNPVEDFEEEFSALEHGSVIHEVLFEFYTERREGHLPSLVNCSEKEFSEAHRRLREIAERKLSTIDIPDAFWELEKGLILGDTESGRGMLSEFLSFERSRSTPFDPRFFEVGFGSKLGSQTRTDETLSREEPISAGAVQLRGKVDRVEITRGAFSILDYKTGKQLPTFDDIRQGISLQLPLYLYTIEKLLEDKLGENMNPAGALYYQLRNPVALKVGVGSVRYRKELDAKGKLLPSDGDLRALIDESIAFVHRYVDEISMGKFPLTSHDRIDKVCTYCNYKTTCRIQSVRRVEKEKGD